MLEKIVEANTLKVGMSLDQPPFCMKDEEGKPRGYDVEFAELLAEAMGVELEIVEYPFSDVLKGLKEIIPDIIINGDLDNRLAGNLNIAIPNIIYISFMMSLRDIAISNGSACTSKSTKPSHVLKAIGLSDALAHASIRFGIGRFNTKNEIDFTINKIEEYINK